MEQHARSLLCWEWILHPRPPSTLLWWEWAIIGFGVLFAIVMVWCCFRNPCKE
jgi:hypothetical protein